MYQQIILQQRMLVRLQDTVRTMEAHLESTDATCRRLLTENFELRAHLLRQYADIPVHASVEELLTEFELQDIPLDDLFEAWIDCAHQA